MPFATQDALTSVEVKDDALLAFHLFKSHCSVSAEFERVTEVKDIKKQPLFLSVADPYTLLDP